MRRTSFGEIRVDTDQVIGSITANEDTEITGANVSLGQAKGVRLDPDDAANPAFKMRIGGGWWKVSATGHLTATSAVCQAHLYRQLQLDAAAAETKKSCDTPAGGGPFSVSEIMYIPEGQHCDVECRLSNETNTNDVTVESGTVFCVEALQERHPHISA